MLQTLRTLNDDLVLQILHALPHVSLLQLLPLLPVHMHRLAVTSAIDGAGGTLTISASKDVPPTAAPAALHMLERQLVLFPTLAGLTLTHTPTSAAGWLAFSACLPLIPHLRMLDLSGCPISDGGDAPLLLQLRRLTSLCSLDISGTRFPRVSELCDVLAGLCSLTALHMRACLSVVERDYDKHFRRVFWNLHQLRLLDLSQNKIPVPPPPASRAHQIAVSL
jgi:Leucine-rich repeat (LRR) protein